MRLPRPVAVVTGASAGVGRATAIELANRGFDVAVIARGEAGANAAADDVRAAGGRSMVVLADVAVMDEVDQAADRIEAELGPIDLWVNNAMTTVFAPIREMHHDEFERAVRVTFLGQVHGTMAALRCMRPRDRGTIVFVGSALAYRGIPLQSAYCSAKFAVRGFHDSLRTELLHEGSGIRTTIVHLPAVNTPQFGWCRAKVDRHPMPVPPIYQPELVASRIADAAQDLPRQRTVGRWNWMIIQLSKMMPGVGDHYMASTGVEGQLSDRPIDHDRPDDLDSPVDDSVDAGAHGIFDEDAGGVLTPSFLRSLPHQALTFARAALRRAGEAATRRPVRCTGAGIGERLRVADGAAAEESHAARRDRARTP